MTITNRLVFFLGMLCFLVACQTADNTVETPTKTEQQAKVIGYLFGRGPFDADKIAAEQLTHINYAFADVVDSKVVTFLKHDDHNLAVLQELKKRNPNLKILVSLGGWTNSKGFTNAALTAESRETMAQSALEFLQKYKLDGIDVDWEYPGQIGDNNPFRPEDKQNFTLMLKALREKLDTYGKETGEHYLLTIASGANQNYLDHTEMDKAHHYLDFVNIMTYDFAGSWMDTTAHHSNLYASTTGKGSVRDAAKAVQEHVNAGIPIEKLVLGVPFYGRSWSGAGAADYGLHQGASGAKGSYSYHDIDGLITQQGFVRYWDEAAKAPYLWQASTQTFVTYEDTVSLQHKIDFIHEKGMGGVMFWEYYNDTTGTLLRYLHEKL